MTIFVGGPIQYAIDGKHHFDSYLMGVIKNIISYLSENGATVLSAHMEEKFGETSDMICNSDISKRDFQWMKQCDKYVAILPSDLEGNLMRSDGTHIELGWASALKKEIYIVCSECVMKQMSKVLQGMNAISSIEYIDIDNSEEMFQLITSHVLEIMK